MDTIFYLIRIQIAIAALCITEAWLEEIIIRMKNPALADYIILNRKEHIRSGLYYLVLMGALSALIDFTQVKWFIIVPLMVTERRVFFEYTLKKFRKRRIDTIEGDQFFDTLSRKIFGRRGGYRELGVMLLITVGLNYLNWRIIS